MAPLTNLAKYLSRRRYFEVGFWILFVYGNAAANILTTVIDMRRSDPMAAIWKPVTLELSSNTVILLLLPAILACDHRWPLRWDSWWRNLPKQLACSVGFSLLHVFGMLVLRKMAYAVMEEQYGFRSWFIQLPYEYLKDVRSYFYILAFVYLYRLLMLRLQGEATLLAAPDTGLPMESIERPERFLVRKLGKEFLIAARDIEWLEASGNYVNIHLRGLTYPLRSTMAAIEERLDPSFFRRVHRGYIINLNSLAHIEPLESGDAQLLLRDGTRVPCSRRYRTTLRDSEPVPLAHRKSIVDKAGKRNR